MWPLPVAAAHAAVIVAVAAALRARGDAIRANISGHARAHFSFRAATTVVRPQVKQADPGLKDQSLHAICKSIVGSCRSMGIEVYAERTEPSS